jgi:hypothetical protein
MPEPTIRIHGPRMRTDSQVQQQRGTHTCKLNAEGCCGLPRLPEWTRSASFPRGKSNHGLNAHLRETKQQNMLHSWPSQCGFEKCAGVVTKLLTSDDSRNSPPNTCNAGYHDATGCLVETTYARSTATPRDLNTFLEARIAEGEAINMRHNVIPRCIECFQRNEPGHHGFVSGPSPGHTGGSGSRKRRKSPVTRTHLKSVSTLEASGGEDARRPPSIRPIGGGGES